MKVEINKNGNIVVTYESNFPVERNERSFKIIKDIEGNEEETTVNYIDYNHFINLSVANVLDEIKESSSEDDTFSIELTEFFVKRVGKIFKEYTSQDKKDLK